MSPRPRKGRKTPSSPRWVNTQRRCILNIQRQPGANVIEVVDGIQRVLPQLRAALPAPVDVELLTDRTTTIRASVADVEFELGLAVVLVVVVIFVFLRSPSATLIPSLSVPLSLVGTLAVMYLAGFSLNNLSLMALTIATGFVVDDAIVMIENISRYIEAGDPPLQAALKGSEQIGFTIISLTISLIAVLIPLLFMPDVVGRLFREFAITLAVTIIISAVVALTLVPMMCAKILRHRRRAEMSAMARNSQQWFDGADRPLRHAARWVLDHQPLTLAGRGRHAGPDSVSLHRDPEGVLPGPGHRASSKGFPRRRRGSLSRRWSQRQQELAAAILKDPDVVSLSSFIGVDGTNPTLNTGRFLINLKPRDQRCTSASDVIRRLERETQDVAGITLYMQPVQDLTIDATVSRSQYNFVLEDANPSDFAVWVPKLLERLQQIPQLEDVTSNFGENGLSAYILIDRPTAARFGITPATVDNALYDSFGQRIVSTIFTQSNQYRVILEADPEMQQSLSSLGSIYLPSSTAANGQVPLSAIAAGARADRRRCRSTISASFRRPPCRSTWRRAPRSARRSRRSSRPSRKSVCRPA